MNSVVVTRGLKELKVYLAFNLLKITFKGEIRNYYLCEKLLNE